jgi:hypothetical protein
MFDVVRKVRDGLSCFLQKETDCSHLGIAKRQERRSNPLSEITIDLRLDFQIPESGLTINGLIGGLKEGVSQIHTAILGTLMKALEECSIEALMQKEPGRYRRNGRQSKPRYLKSSLGSIAYRFAQLKDQQNGRSLMPLVQALDIPAYDHYLEDALEPGIGLSVHVSYRRASSEVERLGGQSMSHTTVHNRLQEFARNHDPFGAMKEKAFRFLVVDGTKVHLQGPLGRDLGVVEMRWAMASLGSLSRFEPVGFWIDTEWAEIRRDLESRLAYDKLEVLFSDGGFGIAEHLLHPAMKQQRCRWHGKREFPYLLYADGFKKAEQQSLVDKLRSVPVMTLTQKDIEKLRPEDRPLVEQMVEKTQQGFEQLLQALDPQRYRRARTYIENLMEPITTFLKHWLENGEVMPLTTNAIESAFSQVSNRIKRVGRRWSEAGLLNWLKVTFYKIFKPELWTRLWNSERDIPKIKLISLQISWRWSNVIT